VQVGAVVGSPRSQDVHLLCHVGAGVDAASRKLREGDLEALFNCFEDLLIFGGADEGDTKTLCAEASCTTDAVQIGVGVLGQIVVDSQVDLLDINTTSKNISGDANALVELLELLVALDAN
jgi:hypothetical protein